MIAKHHLLTLNLIIIVIRPLNETSWLLAHIPLKLVSKVLQSVVKALNPLLDQIFDLSISHLDDQNRGVVVHQVPVDEAVNLDFELSGLGEVRCAHF